MSSLNNCLLLLILIFGCTLAFQLIPYQTEIVYNIENSVNLTDLSKKASDRGSYKTEGKLIVSSVWNDKESQLLKFELKSLKLLLRSNKKGENDYIEKISPALSKLNTHEFYLLLKNGIAIKNEILMHIKDKDVYSMNFKRGIASLFQFNPNEAKTTETDLLGECNVLYHSKSSEKFQKTKTECRNWNLKINRRVENPIGVNLQSFQTIDYELKKILNRLLATETHTSYVSSKRDLGTKILSTILLDFVSKDSVNQLKGKNEDDVIDSLEAHKKLALEADIDGRINKVAESLTEMIQFHKNDLVNYKIGLIKTADAFIKILPTARIAKTNEIVKILKTPSFQECREQLLDLFGATQSIEAHRGVLEVIRFNFEDDYFDLERYLQAISISTRPNKEILEDLFERLKNNKSKNEKLLDSLTSAVAAVASKYKHFSTRSDEDTLVVKITDYMLYSLNSCKTQNCKTLYLRALQNLQMPTTKDTLMGIALKDGSASVSVAALRALQKLEERTFTEKDIASFEQIFYQVPKKFDSTARILALEIILTITPTKHQLEHLLKYLNSNDESHEVKTYLIQKIRTLMEKCPKFRSLVKEILKEKTEINNYYVLGQKGLTTVLERKLYSNPAFNESLISIQELSHGVLKQGLVDMVVTADSEEFSTFKLGLYTQGLSSFVSSGTGTEEEEIDNSSATAGMEIMVQGVHFRPLIFFDGQSELMGHIWSGTASTPTPAYRATTIQQDHEEYILLQNGATIYLKALGAKSINLNGQVELSLWHRNAHTLINQKSASKLTYAMVYGTSFLQSANEISIEFAPEINVKADLDFYTEIMLCIQLDIPDSTLQQNVEKSLQLLGTSYMQTSITKMKYKLPGQLLALNRKNNEMCKKLLR